jgi:hypothetical protein
MAIKCNSCPQTIEAPLWPDEKPPGWDLTPAPEARAGPSPQSVGASLQLCQGVRANFRFISGLCARPMHSSVRPRCDTMRLFAWCLVVAGLVIGPISVSYAIHETTTREAVWIQRELSGQNAARLRQLIRDIDLGVRPAGVIVSPWPGGAPRAA